MASSNLSPDLAPGALPAASGVREAEDQPAHQDAQRKARRLRREDEDKQDKQNKQDEQDKNQPDTLAEPSADSGPGDQPAHQLDHLA